MSEPLRYALYGRVSTAEQAEKGLSLGEQDRRLTEYVQSRGGIIVDRYVDAGVSGRGDDRPELQRLLGDLDRIDIVLALSVDRVMRNVGHFHRTRDRIEKAGAKLVFLTDQHDPHTAIGQLTTDMLASIAAWQSNQKAEQVKATTGVRAREGRYHGGPPPYGYRSVGRGQLVREPSEAAVTERIFSRFAEGASEQAIARELQRAGVSTRLGRKWHQGTVGKILKNPIYRGQVRVRLEADAPAEVFDGQHEALVSDELWNRVQELLAAGARAPGKGRGRLPKGNHLFVKSFLRCGRCGGSMYPVTKPTRTDGRYYEVYACYTRKQDLAGCSQPPIPRHQVDDAVFDYFAREGLDVEATCARLVETIKRGMAETRALAVQAEKEADQWRSRFARVKSDYWDGKLNADDWREQRRELTESLAAAEAQAQRLRERADTRFSEEVPDAKDATFRAIAGTRAAMTAPVRDAKTVEAARAALRTLFEFFELNLAPSGYAADVRLGTGAIPDPADEWADWEWEYWVCPWPRRERLEHWRDRWPTLRRVDMALGDKYASGLTT